MFKKTRLNITKININNNDGFNHSATKFDVGSSNVIVDSTGHPVISKGSLLNDTIISSAKKNNLFCKSFGFIS